MKRKTLKFFAAMAVAAVTFVASAMPASAQFWTGTVFGDSGSATNVMGFDWSSSGSGLAQGIPTGTLPSVGQTFTFRYQAALVGLTNPIGNPITFTGLNSTFEYTAVALLPEVVTSVTPLGGGNFLTVFNTLPGGTWAIEYSGPHIGTAPDANVPAGTGFDTTAIVANGTINPGQISTFTGNPLLNQGIGSTILEGLVSSVDPFYLDPALTIIDFRFEGTLNQPPLDSTTVGFFDNNFYTRYLVTANDSLFKVDGSSKFSTIPEPSTMMLMGSGLLGLAGYGFARRRNKE